MGVGNLIDLFDPIVGHIRERCLSSAFTALDVTRMPVLDPLHPLGIKSGALWLVEGDRHFRVGFGPALVRRSLCVSSKPAH